MYVYVYVYVRGGGLPYRRLVLGSPDWQNRKRSSLTDLLKA